MQRVFLNAVINPPKRQGKKRKCEKEMVKAY
uniref:Uncharacterized protein n=1 Tax=Enterococcus phage PMBT56 TaxID=3229530 RepID=A0AB39C6E7_9CAUD